VTAGGDEMASELTSLGNDVIASAGIAGFEVILEGFEVFRRSVEILPIK
jgi:hypothetical protein